MSRIETREKLMHFIYQTPYHIEPVASQLEKFKLENPLIDEDYDYFFKAATGILNNRDAIDEKFTGFLKNWKLDRLPQLDRAILEIAVYEITECDDIPTSVSINEAVKLAKNYGTENSSNYINGVLSSFEKSL